MNRSRVANRSMMTALLCLVAGLAACASPSAVTTGVGAWEPAAQGPSAATREAIELQWRQAAVATAFLGRVGELGSEELYPQDPDHHTEYETAARHMLARATEFLNANGVVFVEGGTPEADAVERADIRRVESEYAAQAISLQRDVVRMERRTLVCAEGEVGPAEADMAILQALRNSVVSVPLNTGSGGTGASAGASLPSVATGGSTHGGEGNGAQDEASKRRGFTTHPGYQPTPPK